MIEIIGVVATTVSALAAVAVAFIAYVQLEALRNQIKVATDQLKETAQSEKRKYTLEQCGRFESDPELRSSFKHVFQRSENGKDYSLLAESDRFHIITMLNYFDTIAIGIMQGAIVEEIAKDYLEPSLEKAVKCLLNRERFRECIISSIEIDKDHFTSLIEIHNKWQAQKAQIYRPKEVYSSNT